MADEIPKEASVDEILPPPINSEKEDHESHKELREKARSSRWIAWLLDECIRIPGTNFRIGLDPILGLIPGGGETVATVIGTVVLGDAGKKGVPFRTLLRMGSNMLLNAAIGAIPGVGDLFSVWFKSNSRNYELLRKFQESPDGDKASGGWWPFVFIVSVIGLAVVINISVWVFFYSTLFKVWSGIFGA